MRHGQAISNVKALCSCWPEKFRNPLTKIGKEMVKESVKKFEKSLDLYGRNIDLIFTSPLLRTKQTAKIAGKMLKVKPKADKRLREIGFGVFNFRPLESMWKNFKTEKERINHKPARGETYVEISERMMSFLKETDKVYKSKNILIVSHEGPLFLLQGKVMGFSLEETIENFPLEKRIHKAEIRELN